MKRLLSLLCVAIFSTSAIAQSQIAIEVLGHRGGRYEFEENTLSAFNESYKKGVRSYETDIRLTADNELVILHDATLKKIANSDMNVEKSTREQISKMVTIKGNPIPFADQVAEFFSTRDIYYVEWEMKSNKYTQEQLDIYCDKLYKTVMPSKPAGALYIFSSFDKRSIITMKRLHPDAECMFITGEAMSEKLIAAAEELGVKRVACYLNGTTRDGVKKAHKAGLIVNLWPGGSVEDFMLATYLGADIACTDVPVEVLNFLKKKAKWISPHNDLSVK